MQSRQAVRISNIHFFNFNVHNLLRFKQNLLKDFQGRVEQSQNSKGENLLSSNFSQPTKEKLKKFFSSHINAWQLLDSTLNLKHFYVLLLGSTWYRLVLLPCFITKQSILGTCHNCKSFLIHGTCPVSPQGGGAATS